MKNKIYKFLAASLVLLGASSCDESSWEHNLEAGQGGLELGSLSIEVNNSETVITRASVDVNDFIVTVIDTKTESTKGPWKYGEMPEILTLPVGDYKVTVESHKINKAEWDKPYYLGSEPFKIESGKITKIGDVIAKFSSLKVTIKFSDELKKNLGDDAQVSVKGTNGAELVYTPKETRAGYFALDGSTTFAAHFSGSVNGVATTYQTAFNNVEAGQHHILTYGVKVGPEIPEQEGQIDQPSIEMDVDYEIADDINSSTQIDDDLLDSSDRPGIDEQKPDEPGTEEPGEDDPKDDKAIIFEAYNSPKLSIDKVNKIDAESSKEFGNAIIRILCAAGIKDFEVEISSTDNDLFMPAIVSMGLDKFNLTNPDSKTIENLTKLELPYGDDVINKTTLDFNITPFISLLGKFSGIHTFSMKVTDNNNVIKVLDLQFEVAD